MLRPTLAVCLFLALAACSSTAPGGPPEGFELVYSQDFEDARWCTDFGAGDAAAWTSGSIDGSGTACCRPVPGHEGPFGSPAAFLWLGGVSVGDFLLEFDVYLPDPGVQELAVYFGAESAERFVYASLAPYAGERTHDVFRVDGAPPRSISRKRTFGVPLTPGVWQRVTVGRSTLSGRVLIGFGEGAATALTAGDGALDPGWVGFGVRGGEAHFDHVRLWAPEWTMKSLDFLPAPVQSRR